MEVVNSAGWLWANTDLQGKLAAISSAAQASEFGGKKRANQTIWIFHKNKVGAALQLAHSLTGQADYHCVVIQMEFRSPHVHLPTPAVAEGWSSCLGQDEEQRHSENYSSTPSSSCPAPWPEQQSIPKRTETVQDTGNAATAHQQCLPAEHLGTSLHLS